MAAVLGPGRPHRAVVRRQTHPYLHRAGPRGDRADDEGGLGARHRRRARRRDRQVAETDPAYLISASTGLIRLALSAGMATASTATADSVSVMIPRTAGFVGVTSNNCARISRPTTNDPARPSASPPPITFSPSPSTSRNTAPPDPPSAIRTPISRWR